MKLVLAVLSAISFVGCAHPSRPETASEFTGVTVLVESFDPESLVFYGHDSIPYDSLSQVSRVRVTHPDSMAGRVYSIDLLAPGEKGGENFAELKRVGAKVRFRMPSSLADCTEKDLIPVHVLKEEPNQAPQRNAGSRPSSDDSPALGTLSALGPRG